MNWASIFAAIIAVVKPLVEEWLKRWLDDRLKAVERTLPAVTDPEASARVALERVRAGLWFFEGRKKRFVDSLLVPVPKAVAGKPLTAFQELGITVAGRDA